MQEWKIKRMSVNTLERWLKDISKLLSHYLGIHELDRPVCPLCWAECKNCLWKIFEGMDCADFVKKLYPKGGVGTVITLRDNPQRQEKWTETRIGQLQIWEKVITLELERRHK